MDFVSFCTILTLKRPKLIFLSLHYSGNYAIGSRLSMLETEFLFKRVQDLHLSSTVIGPHTDELSLLGPESHLKSIRFYSIFIPFNLTPSQQIMLPPRIHLSSVLKDVSFFISGHFDRTNVQAISFLGMNTLFAQVLRARFPALNRLEFFNFDIQTLSRYLNNLPKGRVLDFLGVMLK